MQTAFSEISTDLTNINKKHLSGYQLTTKLIRGGIGKLGLNGNAKEVLLYLSTCYNEAKGVVYPHQKTIAEALGISEIGVKRAIAELLTKGCILKSKHRKNANEYIITNKVFEAVNIEVKPIQEDTSNNHDDTSKKYHDDTSHDNHEVRQIEVIQQQKVVAFSSKTSKRTVITLDDVPSIIKDNPKVINPCAYWADLDENARQTYLKREAEAKQLQEQKAERKRLEAEEKARKEAEERKLKEELAKPMHEQYSRVQAIKILYRMKNYTRNIETSMWYPLVKHYNLDLTSIYAMNKEDIEALA